MLKTISWCAYCGHDMSDHAIGDRWSCTVCQCTRDPAPGGWGTVTLHASAAEALEDETR